MKSKPYTLFDWFCLAIVWACAAVGFLTFVALAVALWESPAFRLVVCLAGAVGLGRAAVRRSGASRAALVLFAALLAFVAIQGATHEPDCGVRAGLIARCV